jgi:hypothetical protein
MRPASRTSKRRARHSIGRAGLYLGVSLIVVFSAAARADTPDATSEEAVPAQSAHADSSTVHVEVLDQEVVTVGDTSADAGDRASSNARVLSVLGEDVLGAGSGATGGSAVSTTGVGAETCDLTGADLCLALLYGRSESSQHDSAADSSADVELVSLCVGDDQSLPTDACDGVIALDIADSHSAAHNDGTTGIGSSDESSGLLDLCIGGTSETGACEALGIELFQERSDSAGGDSANDASVVLGGNELVDSQDREPLFPCDGDVLGCLELTEGTAEGGVASTVANADVPPATGSASAEGTGLHVSALGQEIITLGGTSAESHDGSAADVTVLSLLGHELIGAHADSDSGDSTSDSGFLTESCEATDGSLCLALLYGHASSNEDATTSHGSSDTAAASACVGGEQASPTEPCDGPIGATVLEGHSDAAQDKGTGLAEADHTSSAADICLGGENEESGLCEGLGATLLPVESHASASPTGDDDASSDSATAVIENGGEETLAIDQPADIAVPPGCSDSSLVCLSLNATTAAAGAAGATAVDADVLNGVSDGVLSGTAGTSNSAADAGETQVLAERETRAAPTRPMATTGAMVLGPLALGLMLADAGLLARQVSTRRARRHGRRAAHR